MDGRIAATRIDPETGTIYGARLHSRLKDDKGALLIELWRQDGVEDDKFFPLLLFQAEAKAPTGYAQTIRFDLGGIPFPNSKLSMILPDLSATITALRNRTLNNLPLLQYAPETRRLWNLVMPRSAA
jgi:hypothetical protein